jgi:hypothetical protein
LSNSLAFEGDGCNSLIMNEANPRIGPTAQESAGGHPAVAHDEHLPTTRLPPVTSPPLSRTGRPLAPLSPSMPFGPTGEKELAHAPARPSSVSSDALGPLDQGARDEHQLRRLIGIAFAIMGLALAIGGMVVGLLVGLSGMSTDGSLAASVGVALIVTRGVIVLGMLAFGCGLLFFATRLLLGRDPSREGSRPL